MKPPKPDPNDIEIHKTLGNISTSITIDVKNNVKMLYLEKFDHKRIIVESFILSFDKIDRLLEMIKMSKCEADEWIYKNVN